MNYFTAFLGQAAPSILSVAKLYGSIMEKVEYSPTAAAQIILEAQLQYIAGYYALVILVAIFGASVTFPLILTPIIEPADPSNLSTVRTLLAVSWVLFVMGALMACFEAGQFYTKGYMKAVTEARKAAENARQAAEKLGAEENDDVDQYRNGEEHIHRVMALADEIVTTARQGVSKYGPHLIATLRAAELAQLATEKETRKAREENLRLAEEHNTRRCTERLAAARLEAERQQVSGNERLVEALRGAEEIHLVAEETARLAAENETRVAAENQARFEVACQTAVILVEARKLAEARATEHTGRWFSTIHDFLMTSFRESDRSDESYQSIMFVLAPIGAALICLAVIIEMYTRAVGIVALCCVGFLVYALVGSSFLTYLAVRLWPALKESMPGLVHPADHRQQGAV
jgi:ABC-type multidrug transport system fused ATPase/permease subunit